MLAEYEYKIREATAPPPATVIVDIVALMQDLINTQRLATDEEKKLLGQWMGWGPDAPAFKYSPTGKWQQIHDDLLMMMGEEQFKKASAAITNSYFTDRYMCDAIWKIATDLGFTGGKVLEPGCGSGAFLDAAPTNTDLPIQFTGIEREPFSAAVAHARFPEAKIILSSLEKVRIIEDSFDLAIGNVPFGDIKITSDKSTPVSFSVHNYFLWYSLLALRPGALGLFISTHYTMDALGDVQRKAFSQIANFLGAIRLPSGAHKAAETQVVTDILIFQKKTPEIAWQGQNWHEASTSIDPRVSMNAYFDSFPEHIVGTPYADQGQFGLELRVRPPVDTVVTLADRACSLVDDIRSHGAYYLPRPDYSKIADDLVELRSDGKKEGSYHLIDGKLYQIMDAKPQLVERNVIEITALIALRDVATELLEAERDFSRPDDSLVSLRMKLNDRYDTYVKQYGFVHRSKITVGEEDPETGVPDIKRRRPRAMYAFEKDPDYAIVLGLEDYDDTTQIGKKAPIFFQRVNLPPQFKEHAETPFEAVGLCLDTYGVFRVDIVAKYLSIDEEKVPEVLGDLIYENPGTGAWELAVAYLSGHVRVKLTAAKLAAERSPERYRRNVEALTGVQPVDLLPEEIHAMLGAPYIGASDIAQFALDTFKGPITVKHEGITSTWMIDDSRTVDNAASTSEWGTKRMDAYHLLQLSLNKKVPVVYDYDENKKAWKNDVETTAAQDKLKCIQERFSAWVWEDDVRAVRVAAVYNRIFNDDVARIYDGSHMTFPGMSAYWQEHLYSWQKDYVYRAISTRSGLCAYPVGAGKTTIEVAVAMTLKRMKLVSKAAIVVPDHLLEQITSEAQRLYPGANILMIGRNDLGRDRRKIFAARVATGNHDFVVMTHSAFGALNVHPDTERAYIEQSIELYREALEGIEATPGNRRSRKRMEKAIERKRQKIDAILARPRDDGVTFEQLGVSYIEIDECQRYKNLGLTTNIPGLQVDGSQRAADLEMKLRFLEEHNEGRPFTSFFSATPISNSMVEAYVMAWYLDQQAMIDAGIRNLDAFASVFIEFDTRVEVSPDGSSFHMKTRPTKFVNMPELKLMLDKFADFRDGSMLDSRRPTKRMHTIIVEASQATMEGIATIVARYSAFNRGCPETIDGKPDNPLWITGDGRRLALDPSLYGMENAPSVKLEAIVGQVLKVHQRWQKDAPYLNGEFKSFQIIFCDMGTPHEKKGDQVYGKLKKLLVQYGIPRHGIRFIHDYTTDSSKSVLFQQCRSGQVAVLIGSTAKMGTGTNIQTQAAALHHADVPWRPDEYEQRNGRVHRPGNLYPEVEIFQYVQPNTFDAVSWDILYRKSVFANQIYSGKILSRMIDVLGDDVLSFGAVKAAATGDAMMLSQATVDMEVSRLLRLQSAFMRERRRDQDIVQSAQRSQQESRKRIEKLTRVFAQYSASKEQGFTTFEGDPLDERVEVGAYIGNKINLFMLMGGTHRIGTWSGVNLHLYISQRGDNYDFRLFIGGSSGIGDAAWDFNINPLWLIEQKKKKKEKKVIEQNLFMTAKEKEAFDKQERGEVVEESEEVEPEKPEEEKTESYKWMIAREIEEFFEDIEGRITHAQGQLDHYTQQEQEYGARAHIPFAYEEELQTQLHIKKSIDTYVKMAATETNTEKLKEVAALRLLLLEELHINPDANTVEEVDLGPVPLPRHPDGEPTPIIVESTAIVETILEEIEETTVEVEPIVVEVVEVVEEPVLVIAAIAIDPVVVATAEREAAIEKQVKIIQKQAKQKLDWDALLAKAQNTSNAKNGTRKPKSRASKHQQSGPTLFGFDDEDSAPADANQISLF